MFRMINLVRNENLKLYTSWNTWVMAGILIVVIITSALLTKDAGLEGTDTVTGQEMDWRIQLTKETDMMKQNIQESKIPDVAKKQMDQMIKTNEYRLKHNIPPVTNESLWGFVHPGPRGMVSALFNLISLFVIIVAASSVAQEFSSGTIKMLLIRPFQRWKVLLSKYISILLFAAGMMVLLFVTAFIVGGISFGFSGLAQPYLAYLNGQVIERGMVSQVLIDYGFACVGLVMLTTMAFMISNVFRNSSLAIGSGIFLMFTGSAIVSLLSKYNWVKYVLFANMNFSQYYDGTPIVEGMTLGFSVAVLAVYFLLFNFASYFFFCKRDVA